MENIVPFLTKKVVKSSGFLFTLFKIYFPEKIEFFTFVHYLPLLTSTKKSGSDRINLRFCNGHGLQQTKKHKHPQKSLSIIIQNIHNL